MKILWLFEHSLLRGENVDIRKKHQSASHRVDKTASQLRADNGQKPDRQLVQRALSQDKIEYSKRPYNKIHNKS